MRSVAQKIVIATLLPLLVVAIGCEIPSADFSEYVGVNFLEGIGFDNSSWIPDQSSPYLLFKEVDSSVATTVGVPASAPTNSGSAIYRLEVLNLIPNGDFEDTTAHSVGDTPDGWSVTDNVSGTITGEISANGSVGGARELTVLIDESDDDISVDLDDPSGGAVGGLVANGIYGVRFDSKPSEELDYIFIFDDTTDDTPSSVPNWEAQVTDATRVFSFPTDFAEITSEFTATADHNIMRVTDRPQSLQIDNIRLVRIDVPLAIRIQLPYSDSGRPDLISGWYQFSFFVRSDPTVGTASPDALNRFGAESVVYSIDGAEQRAERAFVSRPFAEPTSAAALSDDETKGTTCWTSNRTSGGKSSPADAAHASRDAGRVVVGGVGAYWPDRKTSSI